MPPRPIISMIYAFPFFWLANTESPTLIRLAIVLAFAVGNGAMFATQPAFFSELFGTSVRYTGSSLTFNFAGIFGASLAPSIATWLARNYGLQYVGYYLSAAAAVTLVGLLLIRETRDEDLVEARS